MKKLIALILTLAFVFSLAACSKKADVETPESAYPDCVSLLTAIWSAHSKDQTFSIIGGSADAPVNNAPGKYPLDDSAALDTNLGFPTDYAAKIDDAASFCHMMNANTFTAAAYRLVDSAQVDALSTAIADNIHARQWLCGFPDTLIVLSFPGGYVVSAFGSDDLIQNFKTAALTIDGATLISETPAVG